MRVSAAAPLGLFALYALGLAVLAVSLYRVQVSGVTEFRERLNRQAIRRIGLPGLRGRILDRAGGVLADSRPCHDIVCHFERLPRKNSLSNTLETVEADLKRLNALLGRETDLTAPRIKRHLQRQSVLPLTLVRDLTETELARFAEHAVEFPAFSETLRAQRIYPGGTLAAHVLGYTGREHPSAQTGIDTVHYYEDLEIRGRSGLEGFYDSYLTGTAGERLVRVDARGFRQGDAESERKPTHGPDLVLTLERDLQRVLEEALSGVAGAGVVLDPDTGAVRAMASAPTFNPDRWRTEARAYLDDPARPLYNRAVAGLYPPGSTFKPVTAMAALMRAARDAAFDWTGEQRYDCTGLFTLGDMRLRCWDRYGHGPVDLTEALTGSCNAYFCHLGLVTGTNALFTAARAFGLGAPTGIDLNGEAAGTLSGAPWYAGLTCQTAIGQGRLQVTPLQMAVVCAALANGGRIFTPYLHRNEGLTRVPEPVRTLACRPGDLETVRRGMRAVVEHGTGRRIRTRFGSGRRRFNVRVACAGKTGTAERGNGRKDTWIIAFAPYAHPTAAIAMVVEDGESGGKTTAPRVQRVLAHLFGEEEAS